MNTKIKNIYHLNILRNQDSSSTREILTASFKRFRQKLGYFSIFTVLPVIFTSPAQEVRAEEAKKTETSVNGQNVKFFEKLNKNHSNLALLKRLSNYRLPRQKGEFDIVSEFVGGDDCPGNAIPGGIYTATAPFTDMGDTTGANNTVESICSSYCYGSYNTPGADHIYSFKITARGTNPQIVVTATSANYNPSIYILEGNLNPGCPGGTNNIVYNNFNRWIYRSQGGIAFIPLNFAPLNVPLYLFIDSEVSGTNGSGSYRIHLTDVTINGPATLPKTKFDFDADGRADISIFRPSDRTWYLNRSTQGFSAAQWGFSTDKIAPADFDGDGKTDLAVYRDGTWFWLASSNNSYNTTQFGLADDIPLAADFTGDERAELVIYRNGVWWILNLLNNQINTIQFGLPTDKPIVADYDGDGRTDQAVYRNGEWHLNQSSQGYKVVQFGLPNDKLVPADFDGDDKTDLAVYRDGTWYILQSNQGFTAFPFGLASDIPAPADYDGDGKSDAAVFRDGVWYLRQSTNGISIQLFGLTNDKPVAAAYLP